MAGRAIMWQALLLAELYISAVVHLVYAFTIFFTAVIADMRSLLRSYGNPPEVPKIREIAVNGTLQNGNNFQEQSRIPIVLLHGIFGFGKGKLGSVSYWGGAETKDDRVLVPDLGSLTSIHDRACELFYFLKGGTVDYGADHSIQFRHPRFGRTYDQGHHPEWNDKHPVHLIGHSSGAQVARVLQQMLADKEFPGHETSADWVLSITSISGALNGTTRVYIDGIRAEDGRTLRTVSLLQLCRIGALVYEWLDIHHLKKYYSFGFDHYEIQWHKVGVWGLAACILGHSGPFATGDWILPDLSLQAAGKMNSKLKTHSNTYYVSYATKMTRQVYGKTIPSSLLGIHPLLLLRTLEMCLWRHPRHLPAPVEGYEDEDWQENDGALNTISQLYPRFPLPHPNSSLSKDQVLKRGIWYHRTLEADHIFYIINKERAGVEFDIFYDSIFERCRKHMIREVLS